MYADSGPLRLYGPFHTRGIDEPYEDDECPCPNLQPCTRHGEHLDESIPPEPNLDHIHESEVAR